MIYSLNGELIYVDPQTAVIECGGVGYKCTITTQTLGALPEIGKKARVYTYMSIREDAVDLFGFVSEEELTAFKLLITVNGVGPKAAIAILSELTPQKLALAISSGDSKALTKAQGVGNKIAQRIALELKDKFSNIPSGTADDTEIVQSVSSNTNDEAVAALVTLGYSKSEAQSAVSKVADSGSVEEIIKNSLKYLL